MRRFLKNGNFRAGTVLLVLLLVPGIAGSLLVPYPDAEAHWHDLDYWQDNPAAAPPGWTRFFIPRLNSSRVLSPFRTQASEGDSGTVRHEWAFDMTAIRGEAPPIQAILRMQGPGSRPVTVTVLGAQGESQETFRQIVDFVPGEDTRIPLDLTHPDNPGSCVGLEVATLQLPGESPPVVPVILIPGQVSGLLGTDAAKRDVFTGVVLGLRWALILGVVASLLTVLTGMVFGMIAGCFRGVPDFIISRIWEFFHLLPALPFLIVVSTVFKPGMGSLIVLIVLLFWTRVFKPVYAMALQIREEPWIEATRSLGASRIRILVRHVFPALLPYGLAVMALSVPGIIAYEASISLLGLGDPGVVTWGQMLHDAFSMGAVINQLWWWILPPGLAIVVVSLAFALLGRGLDQVLGPGKT